MKQETRLAPITIEAPRRLDLDVGNIEITDCIIRDSLARQPIALVASPMTRLRNLTGSLTVKSPDGQRFYKLDAAQLDAWFPTRGLVARIPRFAFDWRKTKPSLAGGSAAERAQAFGFAVRLRCLSGAKRIARSSWWQEWSRWAATRRRQAS